MSMRKIGRLSIRIFGILCALYGIGLLIAGKGAGMVPIWLVLGVSCFMLSFEKLFVMVFSKTWIKVFLSIGVSIVVIIEGIIISQGCRAEPQEASDYIIVLGASVEGVLPSRTLEYRLETAYQYLITFEKANAVLSGGQGEDEDISEAEAMSRYLVSRGIDSARLIIEDQSTSTYENLQNSFALLGDDKKLKLCIVTSDFHLLRVKLVASELGMQVNGLGSKSYLPLLPNYYLRELFGVLREFIL